MSVLDISEAVHPHEGNPGTVYVTVPIGHGQHVMVAEADAPQVIARVEVERAADAAMAARREAARR